MTDTGNDDAEDALVRVLEDRRRRSSVTSSPGDWQPSEVGERPLLSRVAFKDEDVFQATSKGTPNAAVSEGRKRFMGLVQRIGELKSQGRLGAVDVQPSDSHPENGEEEEENMPEVSGVFDRVGGEEVEIGTSEFAHADTDADRLMHAAFVLDENFMNDEESITSEGSASTGGGSVPEENLPLVGDNRKVRRSWGVRTRWHGFKRYCRRKWRRTMRRLSRRRDLIRTLHPLSLAKAMMSFLLYSWFAKIGVPCLLCAYVLFYYMGNPTITFLDQATASWWLVLVARQTLTLQLAILTQAILIDGLALRSRWIVRVFGPLLTLFAINSKGWPFVSTAWAVWDLFLLHGDRKAERHWLAFLNIELFSSANRGSDLLIDPMYTRVLMAMLLAGVATSFKRLTLAMYFGKKTVANYKSRLEVILADIVLISEVAELACESGNITGMINERNASLTEAVAEKKRRGLLHTAQKWGSIKHLEKKGKNQLNYAASLDSDNNGSPRHENVKSDSLEDESLTSDSDGDAGSSDDSDSESEEEIGVKNPPSATTQQNVNRYRGSASTATLGTSKLKQLLDRWDEPTDKNEKSMADASISDALKFRKALSFMDDKYPFSAAFGLARTRDQCIKSAQKTYKKLLRLEQESEVLTFDTIGLLAFDADGKEDEIKYTMLKRMFRPGRFNEVNLVAFVQGCDTVYRRLLYFRASVGNASMIDRVLEQMIESVYHFILGLVILALLQINPWPLLVSISTLLVSFAFALGPSASRYIEGILLIAARRPYDLGDRICVAGSETATNPGVKNSWFVEDINLFYTTVRFSATNQVATVNNGSIALSRIVNYNRSTHAFINLSLSFPNTATAEQLEIFRESLDKFVMDRPRIWQQIVFFRCDKIDTDAGLKEYSLRLRHRKSWQDASTILEHRSEILTFCNEMSKQLEIVYYCYQHPQRIINSYESQMALRLEEMHKGDGQRLANLDDWPISSGREKESGMNAIVTSQEKPTKD